MRTRPSSPRSPRPRSRTTALVAAAAVLTLGACEGGAEDERKKRSGGASAASAEPSVPRARAAEVEELAGSVGCTAKIVMEVDDYRQGTCETDQAEYVFLTFTTEVGKRGWLEVAQMYGGVYLVGKRWVLSANPARYMTAARAELGGTIEESGSYGSTPAPASTPTP
ncbi:hypothetical protein OK074_0443 [Actinobacteria bacterium OK074]|nr:hypothetical protein OK074_0443 [Actinobacteria bacterium OK074]